MQHHAQFHLLLLTTLLWLSYCAGQPIGVGKRENKIPAVKGDIKFIKCQVCESFVKHALRAVKSMRDGATAAHKFREADVLDMLEAMCNPDVEEGDWIATYDIVEEGDKLRLVEMEQPSTCDSECRTIARACEQLADEVDLTELSGKLYKGQLQRAALTNWMCREESSMCTSKAPPVPKDRKPGPKHVAMTSDEIERRDMMRKMKKAGLSGTLYDRDSMAEEMENLKEMGYDPEDTDGDEIDEAAHHKSRNGHQPVEPGNEDLVTGVLDDVKKAASFVKKGVEQAVETASTVVKSAVEGVSKIFNKDGNKSEL